jgi:hypothetical protein
MLHIGNVHAKSGVSFYLCANKKIGFMHAYFSKSAVNRPDLFELV